MKQTEPKDTNSKDNAMTKETKCGHSTIEHQKRMSCQPTLGNFEPKVTLSSGGDNNIDN